MFASINLQVEMNDRLDRLFELSDSHTSRAAHAQSEAGRDFAELSGNHDALRYKLIYFRDWAKRWAPGLREFFRQVEAK